MGRIITVAIGLVLLVAGTAWAADILTPALSTGTADRVRCIVLNKGTKTAAVTIMIRGANGADHGTTTVNIGAGGTGDLTDTSPDFITYCQVSGIPKGKALVTLCLADASATCTTGVTAP